MGRHEATHLDAPGGQVGLKGFEPVVGPGHDALGWSIHRREIESGGQQRNYFRLRQRNSCHSSRGQGLHQPPPHGNDRHRIVQ